MSENQHTEGLKFDGMKCPVCPGRIIYFGIVNGRVRMICSQCKGEWIKKKSRR